MSYPNGLGSASQPLSPSNPGLVAFPNTRPSQPPAPQPSAPQPRRSAPPPLQTAGSFIPQVPQHPLSPTQHYPLSPSLLNNQVPQLLNPSAPPPLDRRSSSGLQPLTPLGSQPLSPGPQPFYHFQGSAPFQGGEPGGLSAPQQFGSLVYSYPAAVPSNPTNGHTPILEKAQSIVYQPKMQTQATEPPSITQAPGQMPMLLPAAPGTMGPLPPPPPTQASVQAPPAEHPRYHHQKDNVADLVQLFFLVAPLFGVFFICFTELGYGATVFKELADAGIWVDICTVLGLIIMILLYIYDFSHWKEPQFVLLKVIGLILVGCALILATELTFISRPYAPLLAFIIAGSCYVALIYNAFLSEDHKDLPVLHLHLKPVTFLSELSVVLIGSGFIMLLASVIWAAVNNFWWGGDSQREFRDRLRVCENMAVADDGSSFCRKYGSSGTACSVGCVEIESESACVPGEDECLAALLLWASPFILSVLTLGIGVSMFVISRTTIETANSEPVVSDHHTKIFLKCVLLLIFLIWVAASIGGASMALSNVVTAFGTIGLALLFAMLAASMGIKQAGATVLSESFFKRVMSMKQSDWIKAIFIMTISVLMPLFLFFSWLNERVRIATGYSTGFEKPADSIPGPYTERCKKVLKSLENWDWTSVLSKAVWIGIIYFTLQVGIGKVTYVFMAWLNGILAGSNIWAVSAAIYFIGLGLFAIPAVPGAPAYLACGVTIGAAGEEAFGSFWITMIWGTVVAMICKLSACLMQQKIFGEQLGSRVSVRSACGVNTEFIKSVRLILEQKGLTFDKMVILVGGPDWPTSVLTGILKLSAYQMQIGTVPIILPIALTVLAGGGMLKRDEGELWVSLSGLFLTLAGLAFGATMILAILSIERNMQRNKEAIAAIPDDEEVKAYDLKNEQLTAMLAEVSGWESQSPLWRGVLIVAVILMYISTMIFALFGDLCFHNVELTVDFQNGPPLYGDATAVVKGGLGWTAIGLQVSSWVLFYAFSKMLGAKADAKVAQMEQSGLWPLNLSEYRSPHLERKCSLDIRPSALDLKSRADES